MTSIALIGPGRHGTAIAQLYAGHGVDVTLFHHRSAKALAAAGAVARVARNASVTVAASLTEAVADQEVVFLTTLWDSAQRTVLVELGEALRGKILVDPSNPLDVTPAGIVPRTPVEGSAGQFVASVLPFGVGHVKAFSNLATAFITESADLTPPAVLPFAADSQDTADRIRPYLAVTGWRPWLVGGIDQSPDMEIGGRLNAVHGRHGRSRLDAEEMEQYVGAESLLL